MSHDFGNTRSVKTLAKAVDEVVEQYWGEG
jgi:hypothetical protein